MMALAALSVLALGAPVAQAGHEDDTMAEVACTLGPNSVSGQTETGTENGVNSLMQDTGFGGAWDAPQLMDTDPGHFNFEGDATCSFEDLASEAAPGAPRKPGPETFVNVPVDIVASGDFDNLVCGTGTANGDAALTGELPGNPNPDGADLQVFAEFAIEFRVGAGGGVVPPFSGKLVFVVDADESGADIDPGTPGVQRAHVGGQRATAPDGAEDWVGSDMGDPLAPVVPGNEYIKNGGHSFVGDNQVDGGMGTGDVTITPNLLEGGGNCENDNVREFLVNGAFDGILSGEGSTVSDAAPGGLPGANHDSDN